MDFAGSEGNRLVAGRVGQWPVARHALLLHGGGQTRHAWGKTASELAHEGWTAFCLDQRGHGDSAWVESGHYDFEDFAADVGAVAGALRAQAGMAPVLVGASLGGLASLLAIGNGLCEARGLVLVDVAPKINHDGVARIRGFMGERLEEGFATLEDAAAAIAAYLPHRPKPRSLDGLKKNLRLGSDGRWRWHWDPRFMKGPRPVSGHTHETEEKLAAAARRIRIPVLLVRGGSSELVGEDEVRQFLDLVPHASYVDVAGARHMVAGDHNDAFTRTVMDFTSSL
jgi:pimeloyl-ACP methyl ester carboxylesterase